MPAFLFYIAPEKKSNSLVRGGGIQVQDLGISKNPALSLYATVVLFVAQATQELLTFIAQQYICWLYL